MGLRINTNIFSLNAQRNLQTTQKALARALEHLSSGKRVNHASDDPAGLSIATGLESQVRGLTQVSRNINDAMGFLNTAEGAIATQSSLIQRMKELAIQSANGTLGSNDRANLNQELQSLYAEFNRITNQTNFNGTNLLDGSFGTKNLQIGTQTGQTIAMNLNSMQASKVFTQTQQVTTGLGTFNAGTQQVSQFTLPNASQLLVTPQVQITQINTVAGATISTGADFEFYDPNLQEQIYLWFNVDGNGGDPGDGDQGDEVDINSTDTANQVASKLQAVLNTNGYTTGISGNQVTLTMSTDGQADINDDGTGFTFNTVQEGHDTSGYYFAVTDPLIGTFYNWFNVNGSETSPVGSASYISEIDLNSSDTSNVVAQKTAAALTKQGFGVTISGNTITVTNPNGGAASASFGNMPTGYSTSIQTTGANRTISTGSTPKDLALVDLNGDGIKDLVTLDSGDHTVSVMLGKGDGTFGTRKTYAVGNGNINFQLVDLNHDGKLDIVEGDATDSTISILMGNGDGTFQSRKTIATGAGMDQVIVGDFSGDGNIDIVDGETTTNDISGFLGNGDGTFSSRFTAQWTVIEGITAAQTTKNGPLYIFGVGGLFNSGARQWQMNSNGSFSTIIDGGFPVGANGIFSADLNKDGNADLIALGTNNILYDELSNGDGTFQAAVTIGSGASHLMAADLNGDGKIDLLTDTGGSQVRYYVGNGDGTFKASQLLNPISVTSGALASGDINGDGFTDILVANSGGTGRIALLEQNTSTTTVSVTPTIDISTQTNASNLLSILDTALNYTSAARANIGALQSRLNSASSVTGVTIENLSAARSQILDTDIAAETADLVRAQILEQAGVSVLSQANLSAQITLQLLKF